MRVNLFSALLADLAARGVPARSRSIPPRQAIPIVSSFGQFRRYAVPTNITPPDQAELNSSIDRILPSSRFQPSPKAITYDQVRSLLSTLLIQLRTTPELASVADKEAYQSSVDSQIISSVSSFGHTAQDITSLANDLLASSNDPRRQPLAFRLFEIAHKAGCDDAGYYWASMVLQNTAPPPPSGDPKKRINDAVALYQSLSAAGNARGSVGVARLLMQRIQRGQVEKSQWPTLIGQITELYTKAGQKGLSEAWYDLAQLYQESRYNAPDEAKVKEYLAKGAELGHPGCLFSLGTLHLLEELGDKKLAFDLFSRAAEKGDVQSMFQVGSFYFLDTAKMSEHPEVKKGDITMKQAHQDTFGIVPDDIKARYWLERSVGGDYPPSLFQLAAMLEQHRGLDPRGQDKLRKLDEDQADRLSYALLAKLLAILKTSGNLPSLPSQKGQWSNSQFNSLIPQAQAMYERMEKKISENDGKSDEQ